MRDTARLRNIGLVAHIDAGKTTVTEQMLYKSGRIRAPGSVDRGTAHTDSLEIERERGISVRSASTSFTWKNIIINLIDTPGHVDFSSEIERSLRVLDGAILVISAVEGVQAQTEIIWKALVKLNIPTLILINKIDRTGSDTERVVFDIRKLLTHSAAPFQRVANEGTAAPAVIPVLLSGLHMGADSAADDEAAKEAIIEQLAGNSEEILKKY